DEPLSTDEPDNEAPAPEACAAYTAVSTLCGSITTLDTYLNNLLGVSQGEAAVAGTIGICSPVSIAAIEFVGIAGAVGTFGLSEIAAQAIAGG
nr:hypothetical protein [Tanacetum cinerariifolium]